MPHLLQDSKRLAIILNNKDNILLIEKFILLNILNIMEIRHHMQFITCY